MIRHLGRFQKFPFLSMWLLCMMELTAEGWKKMTVVIRELHLQGKPMSHSVIGRN